MNFTSRFNALFQEKKKSGKFSQEELADLVGVSRPTVSMWLSGKTVPQIKTLQKIAQALGVEPSELMGEPVAENEIRGTVVRGLGIASQTIPMQMTAILQCFPEIKDCYPATINVLLEKGLVFRKAEFSTPPIPWMRGMQEIFDFWRIQVRILEEEQNSIRAWVYRPSQSPNRLNPCLVEVLAPKIHSGVKFGASCGIIFDVPVKELSWVSVGF